MSSEARPSRDEVVLVLAPTGRDTPLTCAILTERAGVTCESCRDVAELCERIAAGAGAAVIAEEALDGGGARRLDDALAGQLPWSDLPLLILSNSDGLPSNVTQLAGLRQRGNVTVLDRPLRILTLVSAVHSALRARRRQYEVRDLLAQTRTAVRQRDQFLAMLGHELRNPLATIVNAMGVLDVACPVRDETEREHREIIARQTRHLARLVDDLLDVERITTGKITLRLERVDLGALARRAAQAVEGSARAQRHELAVDVPPHPVLVRGDPIRLEQVVNNLLTNAIKYTPPGGRITVGVGLAGGGQAELRVADNGMGIARELLPRVFDLFAQAERSLDRAQGGLGIGLTLVRSLVDMHGGTVAARSEGPDRGTEFTVRLPLLPAPAGAAAPPAAPAAARGAAPAASAAARAPADGRRVLVVEDHEDARRSLQRLLQLWGHTVHVAADGPAGVSLAAAVRPNIALVDIGLPGLDGYEVARRIRAEAGSGVLLIALTGYGQPEDQARARAAGFDVHLVKPITADRLAQTLERCGKPSSVAG
jgi:signal transduction histidine kinase/CheY-like chemotaxis protein